MYFIFSNYNTISLFIWLAFFVLIVLHRRGLWRRCNNVSIWWLVTCATALHLVSSIFLTWGQYFVWTKSEFTKIFLSSPLPNEVPFPSPLEFMRPLFAGAHGYFAFYAFEHFFLSVIALLILAGLFTLFFSVYAKYHRDNFKEGDIALIALAFLIAGWPGAIVLVPLAFVLAIAVALLRLQYLNLKEVSLANAFLIASPIALFFATPLLTALHLFSLVKL